jgi:hypothetical protein
VAAAVKVLHIIRRAGDELARAAIDATPEDDEARVVLLQDAGNEKPDYDQIVELIEWADKVVAW